ncbi:hypothetical protein V8E53_005241 [Lactarius tabidus]
MANPDSSNTSQYTATSQQPGQTSQPYHCDHGKEWENEAVKKQLDDVEMNSMASPGGLSMTLHNELVQVACEAATLAALKNGTLEPYSTPAPCHSLSSDGHKSETEAPPGKKRIPHKNEDKLVDTFKGKWNKEVVDILTTKFILAVKQGVYKHIQPTWLQMKENSIRLTRWINGGKRWKIYNSNYHRDPGAWTSIRLLLDTLGTLALRPEGTSSGPLWYPYLVEGDPAGYVITLPLLFWGPLFWAAPPSTLVSPSFEGITSQVSGGGLLPGFEWTPSELITLPPLGCGTLGFNEMQRCANMKEIINFYDPKWLKRGGKAEFPLPILVLYCVNGDNVEYMEHNHY